jgi:uncharacterized protein
LVLELSVVQGLNYFIHMLEYLILPGYGGSGPKHWQSYWEKMDSSFVRVEQKDWEHPICSEWVATLEARISSAPDALVLVAHSLACLLVAQWARTTSSRNHQKVRGAFLVGVPNPDSPAFPIEAVTFGPVPMNPLPFPSLIVVSSDDPFGTPEFARACARAWGGGITNIGAKGHINAESKLGSWNEGRKLLDAFTLL